MSIEELQSLTRKIRADRKKPKISAKSAKKKTSTKAKPNIKQIIGGMSAEEKKKLFAAAQAALEGKK